MGVIEFLLNGKKIQLENPNTTRSLLEWLREDQGLCGTKEGCNEGDCGACTVMVCSLGENGITRLAQNACILFLPQLHGKSVRTVEGLSGPGGELHPVQQAMIDHHGSQCGFCTPGFVMSMATAHENKNTNHNEVLAGNLCRCTGYAPIIRAANEAQAKPRPKWINDDEASLMALKRGQDTTIEGAFVPGSLDSFAAWYTKNPDAQIVGGATDIGLWVTKHMIDLPKTCFIGQIRELQKIGIEDGAIRIGAGVNLSTIKDFMRDHHPDFASMIGRYGSTQVRNSATIGGNIANGSPIGDGPPALIALGAKLHLRCGADQRVIDLEDYFISYGKQDCKEGEFVEAVSIPLQPDALKCYKISKRFDQDISALCGCFSITVSNGVVTEARIAFGGMAATPKRATTVEKALIGASWDDSTIQAALEGFSSDYSPISDMRASADYRMLTAKNLLLRYFAENQLDANYTRVLEVSP